LTPTTDAQRHPAVGLRACRGPRRGWWWQASRRPGLTGGFSGTDNRRAQRRRSV